MSGGGGPHDQNQIRSHFASSVIAANMASSGASEHAVWNGALAFSNIGLSGEAVSGSKWPQHSERLTKLVVDLLTDKPLLGILLNEVGNLTHLLDTEGRKNSPR